jgi:hypothetical protein
LITLLINFIIYKSSYLNLNTKTYQITIFEKNFLNNLNDTPINEKYTTLTQASNKYASALSYNFYIINILIVFLIIFSNYYLDISSYSYVIIFLAYYLFLNEKFKATLNLIFKDKLEYQKSKNAYLSLKNYLQNQKNEGLIEEKKPQKKLKKQN